MSNTVDKKRIAKNTLFLYIRMIAVLAANFYAVRLLLQLIRVEDYGVYNIVFGVATMFTMLNGAMSSMVQRFLCYEMGRGNDLHVKQVFTISIYFFLLLSGLIIITAETAGLWFVNNKLNIPESRYSAAQFLYQASIAVVVLKTLQTPYMSAIIAHERMNIFSHISIAEAVLTVTNVFLLNFITHDKLKVYSVFLTISALTVFLLYAVYSTSVFQCCKGFAKFYKVRMLSMSQFFSWSILGSFANIVRSQGLNIVLNIFCGVALNATWALSQKISGAVGQLASNFQMAFNPQLLKSYTNPDKSDFLELIYSSSRYSYLLLYLAVFPLMIETEFFLKLWLGNGFPPYLVPCVQLLLAAVLLEALCGPMWIAAQADGKIAWYQICITGIYILSLIISFACLSFEFSPVIVPATILLTNVLGLIYRLFYLRKFGLQIMEYCKKTLLRILLVSIFSIAAYALMKFINNTDIVVIILCAIVNPAIVAGYGITKKERTMLYSRIKGNLWQKTRKQSA